tara:strand:- start:4511 stop:4888 length:378 start_codon:yes stop_codon:yes gene_type:complete
MRSINFKSALIGFFIGFFIISFSSCQKANDTIGVIVVKDVNRNVVSGATVVLHQNDATNYQDPDPRIIKTDITDANGRAEFTYELEAVLQIDVEKVEGNNIYTGSNVIRLLRGKTVEKTVEIKIN